MAIETKPFDPASYFPDDTSQLDLLNDALHEGHVGYIAAAIGAIAKARGLTDVAQATGLHRGSLHKALSERGNPTMDTVLKVMGELGIELRAVAREPAPA